MRAAIRVATAAALWGSVFVALAQLHITPEKSLAPVIGALLWLLACVAFARARLRGRARRLVVTTAAMVVALLVASIMELLVDNTLVPEVLAAIAFLATLQCFAAAMAEISHDRRLHRREQSWELTGRFLLVVDIASVGVAIGWATNVVERRPSGWFRVTDADLAPVNTPGRVCLALYAIILAAGAGHFVLSTCRASSWARNRTTRRRVRSVSRP
jgi:hypothetical protein